MRLLLRCGDVIAWTDGREPRCPLHGPQGVARVLEMPAPRIRGVATGPHVETTDLPPHHGRLIGTDQKGTA